MGDRCVQVLQRDGDALQGEHGYADNQMPVDPHAGLLLPLRQDSDLPADPGALVELDWAM